MPSCYKDHSHDNEFQYTVYSAMYLIVLMSLFMCGRARDIYYFTRIVLNIFDAFCILCLIVWDCSLVDPDVSSERNFKS